MNELLITSAFFTGLIGSVHCIGMCGGIVGALTMNLPERVRTSQARLFPYLLGYNLGRISSYVLAGMLIGWLGGAFLGLAEYRWLGRSIGGVFMIVLGLYLGGWWMGLSLLERAGGHLWRAIEPLGRRFLPARSPGHALGLGLIWGWLPCGLVYAALAGALAAGSAAGGALVMLAFGLGTLPMLLAIGAAARWLGGLARDARVRQAAAVLIIGFGVYQLVVPPPGVGHQHGGAMQAPAAGVEHAAPHADH